MNHKYFIKYHTDWSKHEFTSAVSLRKASGFIKIQQQRNKCGSCNSTGLQQKLRKLSLSCLQMSSNSCSPLKKTIRNQLTEQDHDPVKTAGKQDLTWTAWALKTHLAALLRTRGTYALQAVTVGSSERFSIIGLLHLLPPGCPRCQCCYPSPSHVLGLRRRTSLLPDGTGWVSTALTPPPPSGFQAPSPHQLYLLLLTQKGHGLWAAELGLLWAWELMLDGSKCLSSTLMQ